MQWWSWAQNNPSLTSAALILAIYLLKELLLFQLRSSSLFYYGTLLPGIVIHEISHAFGCLITGAPIKKIKLFSKEGGFVIHGKAKLPVIGNFIISIMPLIWGLVILVLLFKYSQQILQLSSSYLGILGLVFIYYFALSILLAMLPSYKDISNAIISYVVTAFVLVYFQSYLKKINLSDQIVKTLLVSLIALAAVNLTVYFYRSLKK